MEKNTWTRWLTSDISNLQVTQLHLSAIFNLQHCATIYSDHDPISNVSLGVHYGHTNGMQGVVESAQIELGCMLEIPGVSYFVQAPSRLLLPSPLYTNTTLYWYQHCFGPPLSYRIGYHKAYHLRQQSQVIGLSQGLVIMDFVPHQSVPCSLLYLDPCFIGEISFCKTLFQVGMEQYKNKVISRKITLLWNNGRKERQEDHLTPVASSVE